MATFSSSTFNSALYQAFRPTYNGNLFKMIYAYHAKNGGQFDTALDIGTGTGQVASVLAEKFRAVQGVDASAKMLEAAIQKPNVSYHVSRSEDLAKIPNASVDVLTVAQAMHWFDHPKFFAEVKRTLKPSGTFAAVGYSFVILKKHPKATQRIIELGDSAKFLGPYWDDGRLILDNMYRSIDVPLQNVERHYLPNAELPDVMSDKVTMNYFRSYIKTWSSYKNYTEANPTKPDIVDQVIDAILEEEQLKDDDEVDITWPTVVILGANDA